MSARQLIVLGVALLAAIAALFLVNGLRHHSEPQQHVEQIAGENVLVAARDIAQGVPLSAADLEWRRFPQDSIGPTFIHSSGDAPGQSDYVGAITRRPFAHGEPITQGSVIQPDGHGSMAAQLPPGYRAVAVEIEAGTAAGGYIQPNDHVDVIVTTKVDAESQGGGSHQEVRSDIVLSDVRVLALDAHVQPENPTEGPTQTTAQVAVLELSAADARTLRLADQMGDISLALRGVEAEPPGFRAPSAAHPSGALNQSGQGGSVRVHAFGALQESH